MLIHFWQLPNRGNNCIILKEKYKQRMVDLLLQICRTKSQIAKNVGISRRTYTKLAKETKPKIRFTTIFSISKFLVINGYNEFNLNKIESNIIWIGGAPGKGIINPKLPFNIATREGARFLSAIHGDGCITTGSKKGNKYSYGALVYTNKEYTLQQSIIEDAISIFGGNKDMATISGIHVFFPSLLRDAAEIVIKSKGSKSENNPSIPSFIFEEKELMCGWIEQVIADEGQIRYYPKQYERAIVWRRSIDVTDVFKKFQNKNITRDLIKKIGQIKKCNLIEDEKKILKMLDINCIVKPISIYFTKKGKVKLEWEIRIGGKENLKKLRKLIKIPHKAKDRKFTKLLSTYRNSL